MTIDKPLRTRQHRNYVKKISLQHRTMAMLYILL